MHSLNAQRSRINRVAYRSQAQRRALKPSTGVWCVQSVSTSSATASHVEQAPSDKQAVLYTKFKAHDAAVTALAVLKDEPGGSSRSVLYLWYGKLAGQHGYWNC